MSTPRHDPAKVSLPTAAPLRTVVERLDAGGLGIVLLVDGEGRLAATVTDGDVRRALLAGISLDEPATRLAEVRAADYREPVVARAELGQAGQLALMRERTVRQLPVLDADGRVADVVLLEDLTGERGEPLEALVLAGGLGTRLMPMTKNLPKPMLPVGGRPLLERIVVNLRDAGITRITLGTHYLPERIEEHFGDGSAFGVDLRYVQEPRPLGTVGALGLMPAPEHRLVVINGDILTGLDFRAMADFHAENGADLTVAVRSYRFQVAYGVVEAEGVQVTGLVEKPSFEFFINAGIYVLEPGVAGQVPRNRHYDMTQLIARLLRKRATVIRFPVREYWLDVGQPADYQKANEDLAGGREPLDLE